MKSIAFYNQECTFPIPAIGGGAIEELEHILADENEKNGTFNFIFFQPEVSDIQKQKIDTYHFKHTQLAFLKKGNYSFFEKAVRKVLRYFNINLKRKYDKNFLRELNKYKVDKIILEGDCPISTIRCLSKKYGKENLYLHIHSNYEPNFQIVKYVGHLIGVSEFVLKPWTEFYEKEHLIPATHDVLKNCIRSERFAKRITLAERNEIRKKLGFGEDDFVVIFCGRIIPEKGIFELMQAVCAIESKKIKLLIIGSPNFSRFKKTPYLEKVEACANAHLDRIVFKGYVDNRELFKFYQSADLHVVPSIFEEPAGLVVLEGQMSGIPQIVTKVGGMVEYTNSETITLDCNQYLVNNLSQQIINLSKNKDKKEKIILSGIKNTQKYIEGSYYKNFVDLIEKLNQ